MCFLKMALLPCILVSFYRQIVDGWDMLPNVGPHTQVVAAYASGHLAHEEMEPNVVRVKKFIAVLLIIPIVSYTGGELPRFAAVDAVIVSKEMVAY